MPKLSGQISDTEEFKAQHARDTYEQIPSVAQRSTDGDGDGEDYDDDGGGGERCMPRFPKNVWTEARANLQLSGFIATISCIRNHSVKNGAILIYGRGNLWIYELRRM